MPADPQPVSHEELLERGMYFEACIEARRATERALQEIFAAVERGELPEVAVPEDVTRTQTRAFQELSIRYHDSHLLMTVVTINQDLVDKALSSEQVDALRNELTALVDAVPPALLTEPKLGGTPLPALTEETPTEHLRALYEAGLALSDRGLEWGPVALMGRLRPVDDRLQAEGIGSVSKLAERGELGRLLAEMKEGTATLRENARLGAASLERLRLDR